MLKENETKETIVFLVTFLSLVAFQLGGGGRAHGTIFLLGANLSWFHLNIIVWGPFLLVGKN